MRVAGRDDVLIPAAWASRAKTRPATTDSVRLRDFLEFLETVGPPACRCPPVQVRSAPPDGFNEGGGGGVGGGASH